MKDLTIVYGKKSSSSDNTIYVAEKDFQNPPDDLKSTLHVLNEINDLQKRKIHNKTIPELFLYDGLSMWWLFFQEFFPNYFKIIGFIDNFSKFVNEKQPSSVKIQSGFFMLPIIYQICKRNQIKIKFSKLQYLKFRFNQKLLHILKKQKSVHTIRNKVKKRRNLFHKKTNKIPFLNNSIIFGAGPLYRREIFNTNNMRSERGEYLIQNIINLLDNEKIIGIDFFTYVNAPDNILTERLNDSKISWLPVEVLINNTKQNFFLKKYENILNDKYFQKLFSYRDISLWETVKHNLLKMGYSYYLPYWLSLFDSLKKQFSNAKPKAIFLPFETGPLALIFISSARAFKIKTFGIQHGTIYEHHPNYSHKIFWTETQEHGFPLPDKLLLFGEISKKILSKKGYPEKNLLVFGNSDFFNSEKFIEILKQKDLYKKFGIDRDKKTILFLSSGFQKEFRKESKYDFDTRIWKHLLEKFSNDDKFIILLKPHPAESTTIYDTILKKFKSSNAKIIQGSLIELLSICTVSVCIVSTAIMDSLCIQKPVIQVIFNEVNFQIPYDDYDVALSVKLEKLDKSIRVLVNDESKIKNLVNNSREFIKKYYNIPAENPESILREILEK